MWCAVWKTPQCGISLLLSQLQESVTYQTSLFKAFFLNDGGCLPSGIKSVQDIYLTSNTHTFFLCKLCFLDNFRWVKSFALIVMGWDVWNFIRSTEDSAGWKCKLLPELVAFRQPYSCVSFWKKEIFFAWTGNELFRTCFSFRDSKNVSHQYERRQLFPR